MKSIEVDLPDELAKALEQINQDQQQFIIDAIQAHLENRENHRQYHNECRTACFPSIDTEEDTEADWQTL